MNRLLYCLIFSFIFSWQTQAIDYTVETVPNDHLKNASNYVTNPDGIISAEAEQQVNALIASIEDSTTAEFSVVLLRSIGSDDIDDFGTRLFTSWGIGKDKKDNGLLFLLVYDQREMIFRTGYGLEGVLPDVILSRIIRNDITPLLKQGDFDKGITNGIGRVCYLLKNPETLQEIRQQEETNLAKKQAEREAWIKRIALAYLVISLLVLLFFLTPLFSAIRSPQTNYKKYQRLNSIKIGSIVCAVLFPLTMIAFAVYLFYFLKRLRNKPISCSKCGNSMYKLSETEEDIYLNTAQQTEENIQSMDYDVWLCNSCGNKEILPYNKLSIYTPCPYCHAKTYFLENDYTVKSPTSFSSGEGRKVYRCKNCGKKDFKSYIIPIIVASSGGRGGSRGGGGFSGGSWGGGMTGGGGARGGW